MSSSITFNSYDLQTSNIITEKIFHTSSPDNDLSSEQSMRRDGSFLMSNYWTRKVIIATGHIIGSSVSDLDSRIDTLKKNLVGENLALDIGYNGGTRRYRATVRDVKIEREHFNTYWCPFSIEFVCTDAFGKDTSSVTVTQDGNTTTPFSKVFTVDGSFGPRPLINFLFVEGTAATSLTVRNRDSDGVIVEGAELTVSQNFTDGAGLAIDCENMTVVLDGVDSDFSGVFPVFQSGYNRIQVEIVGTPFEVDMDITYTNLYL